MPESEFDFHYPYSPWLRLSMEPWQPLLAGLDPVIFKKNSLVFYQDSPVEALYLVSTGRVRLSVIDPRGGEQALFIAEKGVPIGEAAIFLGMPANFSAIAIVESQLYPIPIPRFLEQIVRDPALSLHMHRLQAYEKLVSVKQVSMLSSCDAYRRVVITLLNLMQHYGEREEGESESIRISIRFTHSDLAALINASRVTVNNVFLTLIDEGIIERREGYYIIHRPRYLEELSQKANAGM